MSPESSSKETQILSDPSLYTMKRRVLLGFWLAVCCYRFMSHSFPARLLVSVSVIDQAYDHIVQPLRLLWAWLTCYRDIQTEDWRIWRMEDLVFWIKYSKVAFVMILLFSR